MKRISFICVLLIPILSFSQGGASCADPIPITMDGVCRNYTISSATGNNLVCTSSGTTPITYFSITSNASAQNMLLKVTGSNNQPIEVAFYHSTSCTNGNLESASSICFYDGHGDWAPAEDFVITPNTTYILRIKTPTTGSIQICGQYYTPPNNSCLTATPIGPVLTFDNNATHKPVTGISPAGLCAADASDIYNTALYVYTVDLTGTTTVSVENMNMDNNYQSDLLKLGYKVGVFTGNCSSLTSLGCYIGVATNAQLVIGILPAGTKVYVAIDGILGSNCDYGIRAINSTSLLTATLKYFTAWKAPEGNILKWVSLNEYNNASFEVERSVDGVNYKTIDHIAGQVNSNSEKDYQYIDLSPPAKSFYRLKMTATSGKSVYSKVISVDREFYINSKVRFSNIVSNQLALEINGLQQEKVSIKIVDQSGREVYHQNAKINSGNNLININTGNIAKGIYYLVVSGAAYREAFLFLKS
jgi:hypothetical protein